MIVSGCAKLLVLEYMDTVEMHKLLTTMMFLYFTSLKFG